MLLSNSKYPGLLIELRNGNAINHDSIYILNGINPVENLIHIKR